MRTCTDLCPWPQKGPHTSKSNSGFRSLSREAKAANIWFKIFIFVAKFKKSLPLVSKKHFPHQAGLVLASYFSSSLRHTLGPPCSQLIPVTPPASALPKCLSSPKSAVVTLLFPPPIPLSSLEDLHALHKMLR